MGKVYDLQKRFLKYYQDTDESQLSNSGKIIQEDISFVENPEEYFGNRIRTIKEAFERKKIFNIDDYEIESVFYLFKIIIELSVSNRKNVDKYLKKEDVNMDFKILQTICQHLPHNEDDEKFVIRDLKRDDSLNRYSLETFFHIKYRPIDISEMSKCDYIPKDLQNLFVKVDIDNGISPKEKDRIDCLTLAISKLCVFDKFELILNQIENKGSRLMVYLYWEWDLWNKLWFHVFDQLCLGRGDLQTVFLKKMKKEVSSLDICSLDISLPDKRNIYREFVNYVNLKIAFAHYNNENRAIIINAEKYICIEERDFAEEKFNEKKIDEIMGEYQLKKRFKEMCESGSEKKAKKMETFEKNIGKIKIFLSKFNQRTGRTLNYSDYRVVRAVFRAMYVNYKTINRRQTKKIAQDVLDAYLNDVDINAYHHISSLISLQLKEEYGIKTYFSQDGLDIIDKFSDYSFWVIRKMSLELCYVDNEEDKVEETIRKLRSNMLTPIKSLYKSMVI